MSICFVTEYINLKEYEKIITYLNSINCYIKNRVI